MTRYLGGSLAIRVKSLASSLKVGLIFSSIIQPKEKQRNYPNLSDIMYLCRRQYPLWLAQWFVIFTFDHDHVNIYGTDVGLWQTFALLQQARHFLRLHRGVRLRTKWHHLPHCHPCSRAEIGTFKFFLSKRYWEIWFLNEHRLSP